MGLRSRITLIAITLAAISATGKIGTPTAVPGVPALGNQGAPLCRPSPAAA